MSEETKMSEQFLTFRLGEETFALDIFRVCEVLEFKKVTKVPRTPDFMRGVINLRGKVVPVIDLNLKFDLPQTETTVNTCVIIVEVTRDGESLTLGALADSVREVMELDPSNIEPPPKIGTSLKIEFIKGMGKHNGEFLIILDIDKIFSANELDLVNKVQQIEAAEESNSVDA